jgi:hypothetical protein
MKKSRRPRKDTTVQRLKISLIMRDVDSALISVLLFSPDGSGPIVVLQSDKVLIVGHLARAIAWDGKAMEIAIVDHDFTEWYSIKSDPLDVAIVVEAVRRQGYFVDTGSDAFRRLYDDTPFRLTNDPNAVIRAACSVAG